MTKLDLTKPTREEADEEAESDRIACVKVTYTDGEGID